ncbi:MAG: FHA domain-containing protein, partial [Intrasporangium sp.]|uniref:FHA domain-containing protein n=1 Tax=Intrasporangium sp. TaxID=1925024 RepID=UPI003F7FB435
ATPSAPPAAAAPEPGGLISSVPWATQPANPGSGAEPAPAFTGRHSPPPAPTLLPTAAAPSPQPPAPMPRPPADPASHTIAAEPDDAELTVDRSALLAARNAALDGGPGPRVMAVLCAAGHSSPPHANHCRVCGEPIPPQEPFEMPRPALGILRLSTGDIVTLDRNVLFGRAPKPVDGLSAEEQPHVVKVPSPERDVSRNHVEVLVEGWHVLIRDLGTTNGTTVALPGETAVRLRANDQQSLEPGSVVSMADEVSFIFEVGS